MIYRVDCGDEEAVYAIRRDGFFIAVETPFVQWQQTFAQGGVEALDLGGEIGPVGDVERVAPVAPSKVVCVGRNYLQHARELDNPVPEEPLIFLKPPSAIIGPGEAIELPEQSDEVHHEAELAVVIGRRARDLTPEEAEDVVLGYTVANDVTARDIQRSEPCFSRAKGFDTFCPIGPGIMSAADFDPAEHTLRCRVDDEVRQESTLDDFIFSIPEVLAFITRIMTLEAGDVVLTGTPAGVGPIVDGATVRVEVDGIGTLENPVHRRPSRR